MRKLETTKMEWISVEDGLPPNYERGGGFKYYLVRLDEYYPNFDRGILIDGEWCPDFTMIFKTKVTHWCDVP